MLKSVAAALTAIVAFSFGIAVGSSIRPQPARKVTCLGSIASFENVTWNNVAYTQNEAGDLAAAVSEAVCKRRFRRLSLIGGAS